MQGTKGKGWGAAIESTSESSKTNHLLLGSRACDLRPFPWKSSVQAARGAWRCCSTSFALLLHLQQMFKHLGPCPLHVSPSTGTLAPHGHLLWHGLAPVPVWSESCGHYSPVCSFRVYVQMLCKSCPVPCLLLWWGWRTRSAHARYCPMLWRGFLVSDVSTSSKKLQTLLFLLNKALALLCCPAWSWRRKGWEIGGSSTRSLASSVPLRPGTAGEVGWWSGSHACVVSANTVTVSKPGMGQQLCASCPTMRVELCHSHLVFCQFRSLF